jgi:septal ring factor EnvC (AmiA/AmiB activator)
MPQLNEPPPASPNTPDQVPRLCLELSRENSAKEYEQNATKQWTTQLDSIRDRNTPLQKALQATEDARRALAAKLHQSEHERGKLEAYKGQDRNTFKGLKAQLAVT